MIPDNSTQCHNLLNFFLYLFGINTETKPDTSGMTRRYYKITLCNNFSIFIENRPARIAAAITDAIRAVVRRADFVVIPVKASPHDLRAVGRTVEIVQQEGKSFAFVVTQAKGNALLTIQAMAALSEYGVVSPAVVHDRVDYAASMTDGRTVLETDNRGRSASETADLWEFVKGRMNESTKARKVWAA